MKKKRKKKKERKPWGQCHVLLVPGTHQCQSMAFNIPRGHPLSSLGSGSSKTHGKSCTKSDSWVSMEKLLYWLALSVKLDPLVEQPGNALHSPILRVARLEICQLQKKLLSS